MNASQRRQVERFFSKVEERIARERALSEAPGVRATARQAAARRAQEFAFDLDYLRARYTGEGSRA